MTIALKIFLLFSFSLSSYSEVPSNLDSLLQLVSTSKSDTSQYNLLSRIAIAYSDSNYSKSLEYWQKALHAAEKTRQRKLVADSYHQIGYSYQKMGEFSQALTNLSDAADIYTFLNDKKSLGGVLNDIGLIYRNWGKYDKALENYLNALRIFDEIYDVQGSAMVSNSIGQIYYYREEFPKAIDYFVRYLDVNKSLDNQRAVAGAANNIASAYLELKRYDDALQYYLNALKIYDSLGVKIGVAIIRDNIGSLFYQKNQYDDALLYHSSALSIFTELGSPVRMCNTLTNIGKVYLKQGRMNVAIDSLEHALHLAIATEQKDALRDIYQLLAEAHQSKRDFEYAYQYLQKYDAIKDSIANAESVEKIEKLQAEYDTERREGEIASINHQLEIQRKILYTFWVFVAILLALAMLLIKENSSKKKALRNFKLLETALLGKVSEMIKNIGVIGTGKINGLSASWEFKPSLDDVQQDKLYHFTVNDTVFVYILNGSREINTDLINLVVYNFVAKALHNQLDQLELLDKLLTEHLAMDSLTSRYNGQYKIISLIMKQNKVLNLAGEHFAIKQSGTLLMLNEKQWFSLKKDDVIYLYTVIADYDTNEEKRSVRKIFKTLSNAEFDEQQELALNYLKSIDMDLATYIFALKV